MLKNIVTGLSIGKILDVGTGRGELIDCLIEELENFDEIIGIDTSEKSKSFLDENFKDPRVKFLNMDAAKLDFEDNYFDMVCISNTLHHLNEDALLLILNEMKRVLKPNGYLLICEMYSDNQTDAQMGHVYFHHYNAFIDRLNGTCHKETFKRSEILDTINKLGISVEKTSDFAELDDPCTEEEITNFINSIDKRLETLKDSPDYEAIKTEGEKVKVWLNNHGLCGATELVVLGKKL